jgi:ABC-type antimicrobial peptide transport system permease subunit
MNKIDIVRMAYSNLFRRKVRAILTIIGVFIGTMAIVVMLSLGIGLDRSMRANMESWGDLNIVTVNQGRSWDPETGEVKGEEQSLNDAAVEMIRGMSGITAVMPSYQIGVSAKYGKKEGYLQLVGVDPAEFSKMTYTIAEGRMLTEADSTNILVGWQVVNQFWDPNQSYEGGMMMGGGQEQANSLEMLNKVVYMQLQNNYSPDAAPRKQPVIVVGVLEGEFKEHAYSAYAPMASVKKWRKYINDKSMMTQEQIDQEAQWQKESGMTVRDPDDYDQIMIRCQDVASARTVAADLREQGYNVYAMADYMEGIEKQSLIIQAVLGGIGAITLLVASIGIANTMVMAIYERTREIGVMKVIGASVYDVRMMFLMEAGLIGVAGGTLGLGCSYGLSALINHFSGSFLNTGMAAPGESAMSISVIPPWLALFAMAFAFLIGIVAGWYPARRAAKLSPITAIRNE